MSPTEPVGLGDYALGSLGLLAIVVSLAYAALQVRRRFLPAWEGAPARLAEAVLAIGWLILISEALGVVDLFYATTVTAASILTAAVVGRVRVPPDSA